MTAYSILSAIGEIRVLEQGGGAVEFTAHFCLSNSFDKTRWSCSGNSEKSEYKRSQTFCLSKTGVCAAYGPVSISFRILQEKCSLITFICMPPFVFWFQCCQLSRILEQSEVSDNKVF